jgi:hypothetical protein
MDCILIVAQTEYYWKYLLPLFLNCKGLYNCLWFLCAIIHADVHTPFSNTFSFLLRNLYGRALQQVESHKRQQSENLLDRTRTVSESHSSEDKDPNPQSDTGTVTEDDIIYTTTHSRLTVHTVSLLYFHYYYFQPNCKSDDIANWTASEISKIQLPLPLTGTPNKHHDFIIYGLKDERLTVMNNQINHVISVTMVQVQLTYSL